MSDPRDRRLRSLYGITADEYDALLHEQGGRCAICERRPKKRRLAVDHCHKTGFVRGLLCTRCNRALGAFDDNRGDLSRAVFYLEDSHANFTLLTQDEKDQWLPYRGRSTGKARRTRIRKLEKRPYLPLEKRS